MSTFEIVTLPANYVEARVHNLHIHYESQTGFVGVVTLQYEICNTDGLCDVGDVTITVED